MLTSICLYFPPLSVFIFLFTHTTTHVHCMAQTVSQYNVFVCAALKEVCYISRSTKEREGEKGGREKKEIMKEWEEQVQKQNVYSERIVFSNFKRNDVRVVV